MTQLAIGAGVMAVTPGNWLQGITFPSFSLFPPGGAVAMAESLQTQLHCVNVSALVLYNRGVLIPDLQQVLLEVLCTAAADVPTCFTLD